MHIRTLLVPTLAVALAACGPGGDVAERDTEQAVLAQLLYDDLRDVEELFPVPATSQTIQVGAFHAATGTFSGLTSTEQVEYILGKPRRITLPASATIDAVNARLRFTFPSRGTRPIRIHIDGRLYVVPSGRTSYTINVGKARSVPWRIESGTRRFSDRLEIRRPGVIGVGAFTVEALPVAVLYEPPQYGGGLSRTTLSASQSGESTTGVALLASVTGPLGESGLSHLPTA